MARGDHIRARRPGYWHHGIDCGDGTVIHYAGELINRRDAAVKRTPLAEFAKGGRIETVSHASCDAAGCVLHRAESRIGETRYGAFRNNCEHFARWCKTGVEESKQVRRFLAALGSTAFAVGCVVATVTLSTLISRRGGPRRV